MGVLFPFSHFEEEVMRVLNIAPSCQAFNSWNFVREFEIVCRGLEIPPSVGVLFLFYATRHSAKWGWVTLGMLLQKSHVQTLLQSLQEMERQVYTSEKARGF
ncbi:hypothetical protein KIW84_014614 [Lathyrus oleraceus]|uniref:Uncharacterized protein n=1 Tax=Pisum sativum TaxID=3888 RepID=A0A9D5BN66_PEA|nr:hypothetical protein KIW84_014614 [Pisum sativum]